MRKEMETNPNLWRHEKGIGRKTEKN